MRKNTFLFLASAFIALLIIIAVLLQYDAITFFHQNTNTHKVDRNKIRQKQQRQDNNAGEIFIRNNNVDDIIVKQQTNMATTDNSSMVDETKKVVDDKSNTHKHHHHLQDHLHHSHHLEFHPASSSNGDINKFLQHRSLNGRILLIPVNSGYLDFGLNLLCSLEKVSSSLVSTDEIPLHIITTSSSTSGNDDNDNHNIRSIGIGYTFVAMDEQVEKDLIEMQLPVFRDPDMPFVSSKSAEWANPKFHHLVCTKLFPVLRALKQNLSVVLSDADIVFRKDPFKYFTNRNHLDMIFSIGSCHRDLPDDHDLMRSGDGLGKLNTGFYIVKNSKKKIIDLFSNALQRCISSNSGNNNGAAGEGDQPAMNAVLDENIRKFQQQQQQQQSSSEKKVHYGFFDGCLFANGCIYFKHLCANSTSLDPASPEAISILKRGGKMPHHKIIISSSISSNHQKAIMKGNDDEIRRDDPVLVHANFLVGKGDKIKHLKKYGLWDEEKCIQRIRKQGKKKGDM